jgi:hypothetical protein
MTIKELIKSDFDVELDISGGTGNSLENSIIIHRTSLNDYVGTEYFILKCLGAGRRVEWNKISQELLSANEKKIDKIKIQTIETTAQEIITQIENYYFDITECLDNSSEEKEEFNEEKTISQITDRINEMKLENKFNFTSIEKLKQGDLFDNIELTIKFLKVISEDESLPLYEKMMIVTGTPILDVLRIVAPNLK